MSSECCPPSCTEVTTVQVPGPAGPACVPCEDGEDGENAFTTFITASFAMPAELGSAVASVASTAWMGVNQILYAAKTDGSVMGYLQVTAIGGATSVTLKNLEDTATSSYSDNSAPGSLFTVGSTLSPGGKQGPTLASSGAAGGDLKSTYPNPKLALANLKGSSIWGNGTDAVSVPAGTDGHMLAADSTDAEGIKYFAALPLTGGTNVSTQRIARLSATTGSPVPLESSKAVLNNPGVAAGEKGALVLDASAGNARGVDAVDLQVVRSGATMVASGTNSTISGGQSNTASGADSTVAGGSNNAATGAQSVIAGGSVNQATAGSASVGGGETNIATAAHATVAGGNTNEASGSGSSIGGGGSNVASGISSTIGGGDDNTASGLGSTVSGGDTCRATNTGASIGGGQNNLASAVDSTIAGGNSNQCSGLSSAVLGGVSNAAAGEMSAVIGGGYASATKYGQIAHANGMFAALADAQAFSLVWRATTVATNSNIELFLDGATAASRASVLLGKTLAFTILVVGRSAAGVGAAWEIKGAIQNNGGTTALVSAVTTTLIADGTGSTWGVVGNVAVTADNVNDSLRIGVAVTVDPGVTVRWVATGTFVECGH